MDEKLVIITVLNRVFELMRCVVYKNIDHVPENT